MIEGSSVEEDFDRVLEILDDTRGAAGDSVTRDAYVAVLLGALHGERIETVREWAESRDVAERAEFSDAVAELRGLSLVDTEDDILAFDEVMAEEPHHVADVVTMLS